MQSVRNAQFTGLSAVSVRKSSSPPETATTVRLPGTMSPFRITRQRTLQMALEESLERPGAENRIRHRPGGR